MLAAYLLHSRPYRETSLLLELFTLQQGRMAAMWRGGRRAAKGSVRSGVQLFQPLLLDLTGTAELKTLRQVEVAGPALVMQGPALFSAFYLNELVVRLLPVAEEQTGVFAQYAATLATLAEPVADADVASALRQFEAVLLESLGYGLDYGHDSGSAEPVQAGVYYDFHPERGFRRCATPAQGWRGDILLRLSVGDYSQPVAAQAAKHIHRLALAHLLGPRPLKSRELFLAARE